MWVRFNLKIIVPPVSRVQMKVSGRNNSTEILYYSELLWEILMIKNSTNFKNKK